MNLEVCVRMDGWWEVDIKSYTTRRNFVETTLICQIDQEMKSSSPMNTKLLLGHCQAQRGCVSKTAGYKL